MRRLSLKGKLTLWITALLLVMLSIALGFLLSISSQVALDYTYRQLDTTVRKNLSGVSRENGRLAFSQDFAFVENGIYTVVYSDAGSLLAGQLPLRFPDALSFENGMTRRVETDSGAYCILDLRLPMGWNDGVWIRGITAAPDTEDVVSDMLRLALLLLPLAALCGALGAYLLSFAALRPVNRIIATVAEIGEGRDLSRRVGLPPGQDEVGRLGQAFDGMFQRLERSFEAEKQFTSDASHELRTPIAVILAQCSEALSHAQTAAHYQEALEVIHRQARRMNTLVSQLLQMTRLEQGTQKAHFETADLTSLTEVLCAELPLERGITVETDIQPEVEAEIDVTLMSRLLQNLLNNAVRYGREGGHIWVTLRQSDGLVTLCVRDDGAGIPAGHLPKIWQRFYQADASHAQRGAGLGLAMVRQIAALHGGAVTADSIENAGSTFTLRFPQRQGQHP